METFSVPLSQRIIHQKDTINADDTIIKNKLTYIPNKMETVM
jgi:hypothetical protein